MATDLTLRRIFKFPTGAFIPEGAQYLSTEVQTKRELITVPGSWVECYLVWHYFLVEVENENADTN